MNNEKWTIQPLHTLTSVMPLDDADMEFIKESIPSLYYVNESTQETFNQLLQRLYVDEKRDIAP